MACSMVARDCSSESRILPMEATTAARASATWRCWSGEGRVWWRTEADVDVVDRAGRGGGMLMRPGEESEVVVEGAMRGLARLGWRGEERLVVVVEGAAAWGGGMLPEADDGSDDDMMLRVVFT